MPFLNQAQKEKRDTLMQNIVVKEQFLHHCKIAFRVSCGMLVHDMTDIQRDFFYLEICKKTSVEVPTADKLYLYFEERVQRRNKYGLYQECVYIVFWENID